MQYEIDYIPVGDGEKGGDAICLRFGNLSGSRDDQVVVVIDGGYKDSGEKLVEHIQTYYDTNRVDLVISTHPDGDHTSGLTVVLEKLEVDQLAMHLPWKYSDNVKKAFDQQKRANSESLQLIEASLRNVNDIESLADRKGITIVEPFQGVTGYEGIIHILGPSQDFYQTLLTDFKTTIPLKETLGIFEPVRKMAEAAAKRIRDAWHIDLLDDDEDTTSAENNSSVITLLNFGTQKLLFTGDAGKTALHLAADYANSQGLDLTNLNFFDVPHHGSKRNINSKIIKRMKGTTSFVSAPLKSEKHPAKKVTNALKKHGSKVFITKGNIIHHHHDAPDRPGWVALTEEPFHDYVEE
jgi:beta-lactamase superfamily II metal-dependent hydrolase